MHDYQTNVEADQIIKAVHHLTAEIHDQVVRRSGAAGAIAQPPGQSRGGA